MNWRDRKAWRNARTIEDLGELVIRWLNGEIKQTPCNAGPPAAETVPLADALTVINRGAFVTVMSQLAETCDGETWNTWVDGFATDAVLETLREATAGTPLTLTACRRQVHECDRCEHLWYCPWSEITGYWADKCPAVMSELRTCWFVTIEDPEPGRNDLLWDTLTRALAGKAAIA